MQKIFDRKIPKEHLQYVRSRDAEILKRCAGKKVVHIGATDHPFTKERWDRGDLLYLRIAQNAEQQIGIDLSSEAAEFLNKQKLKNSEVIIQNMNNLHNLEIQPDIIIFGDTLEHLINLGTALENLKQMMTPKTELLISVPNAFYIVNFIYAIFRMEHQHPDHSVAFTYKTLTQLLDKNDFWIEDFKFSHLDISLDKSIINFRGGLMRFLALAFSRFSPVFAETLLVTVKLKDEPAH